jgi:hypothetical protein
LLRLGYELIKLRRTSAWAPTPPPTLARIAPKFVHHDHSTPYLNAMREGIVTEKLRLDEMDERKITDISLSTASVRLSGDRRF